MNKRSKTGIFRRNLLFVAMIPVTGVQAAPASLEELVVTGNRAPAQISEVPGTIWVLEGEDLQQQFQSGQDLKTVLGKLVPGLDLAPQGRTNFGQNLRGRSVLVMIDGVSLNSSRGISRQFDSIDPFNIARIEVLSGATALYGGGSTGGIINIITKKGRAGDAQFSTELGASSGFNSSEDRSFRFGQSIAGGSDDLKGRLAIATERNGAFYDGEGDRIIPDIAQTDLQYNRSVDIMGSVQANLSENQSLDLTAQYYNSRFDGDSGVYLGPNFSQLSSPEIRDGYSSDRDPETDRYLLNANYRHLDVLGHTAYLQLSTRKEEASFHPYPYINQDNPMQRYIGASAQETEQHFLKAMLVRETGDWKFTYGLDLDREDFQANQMVFDTMTAFTSGGLEYNEDFTVPRYPDYRVEGIAGFLQAEWQATDRLRLNAGVRQRKSWLEVSDVVPTQQQIDVNRGLATGAEPVPGGKNDYDVTLVNAGAIFNLTDDQQIWGNFSQGFEIPDPGKVFGRGVYQPNPLDGTEPYVLAGAVDVDSNTLPGLKTNQVELGWRTYTLNWDAQVAAYYIWSDKTTEVTDTLNIDVVDNETRDYGLEASLQYRFADYWSVGAQGHYIRSEVKNDGDWEKKDARYASLPSAMAFVGWSDDKTSVRLQGSRAFDMEDDADREIEGYTTFDLQAARDLPLGRVNVGITNLLDEQYDTVWGQRAQMFYGFEELFDFKGQGRTYTLTYSVDY